MIAFPNEAARLASLKASDTVWEKRTSLININENNNNNKNKRNINAEIIIINKKNNDYIINNNTYLKIEIKMSVKKWVSK